MLFESLKRKAALLPKVAEAAFFQSLSGYEQEMADINTSQMYAGEEVDGLPIVPAYRPNTVAFKKMKGQPYDRVTLKDTGSFYRGVRYDVLDDAVVATSSDKKTVKLVEKYGENLFGINPERYNRELYFKVAEETNQRIIKFLNKR